MSPAVISLFFPLCSIVATWGKFHFDIFNHRVSKRSQKSTCTANRLKNICAHFVNYVWFQAKCFSKSSIAVTCYYAAAPVMAHLRYRLQVRIWYVLVSNSKMLQTLNSVWKLVSVCELMDDSSSPSSLSINTQNSQGLTLYERSQC